MSRWTRFALDLSPFPEIPAAEKDVRVLQTDRTVQVVNAVQPGVSLQIQGTVDGTNWVDIGSPYASPSGGFLAIPNALRAIRVKTNAYSDAVAVSDQLVVQKNVAAPQTVTSTAPATSAPAVFIAGFDERAV